MPRKETEQQQIARELARHIGGKLDALAALLKKPQQLKVNLEGDKNPVTPEMIGELRGALAELEATVRKPQKVKVELPKQQIEINATEFAESLEVVARSLQESVDRFAYLELKGVEEKVETVVDALQQVSSDIKAQKPTDLSTTNKLMKDLVKATKGIKLEEKDIDLSAISEGLDAVVKALDKKSVDYSFVDKIVGALWESRIEVPKTFTLDEQQFRALKRAGGTTILVGEDGTVINPATEEKQDTMISAINAISGAGTYITQLDSASPYTYIGKANPGTATSSASWQIFRMDETNTPDMEILYADGDVNFDNIWDNRVSLSYS